MELFWKYETELPQGAGFGMWGMPHILWLLFLIAFTFTGGFVFVRLKGRKQKLFQVVLSAAILLVELVQDIFLAMGGHLTVEQLPLHLCGLAVFITATKNILAYFEDKKVRKRSKITEYLANVQFGLCLPGAFAALLFPDWTVYPPLAFMSIVGFVNHGFLTASGVYEILNPEFKIHIRNIWRPISFLLVITPIMYVFDRYFKVNYLFLLSGPTGSPLQALQDSLGKYYMAGYAGLVLTVMTVWYLLGMTKKNYNKA